MTKIKKTVCLLSMCVLTITSYAYQKAILAKVSSSGLNMLRKARMLGAVEANKTISFSVWLKMRNKKELEQLAHDVYDPNSPKYQQFLTPELYEQRFAPSKEAEMLVKGYFIKQGMNAKIVNHSVRVEGTAKQIQQALRIKMYYYQYEKERVYANSTPPQLLPDIAPYISEIKGLSTIPEFHAFNRNVEMKSQDDVHDLNFKWNHFVPSAIPTNISLQGFSGVNLQKAYNINNIPTVNGVSLDGSEQTLVIVDRCGTNNAKSILKDANQYFVANKIKPFQTAGAKKNFAMIHPDGTPFVSCPNASSFSREITLDVESSHTLAPGANTVLVLDDKDQAIILMDTISILIHNQFTIAGFSNAYVISNSWGGPDHHDDALEGLLLAAAAGGVSVNFSSGDCGDNTYITSKKCTGSSADPTTNYPASSPYVTAVGATAMFVDNNYRYAFETVWGTVRQKNGVFAYDGGTGGGISKVYQAFPEQSVIANFTAGGYGVISQYKAHPQDPNGRAVPDIAMLGDPQTGLLIVAEGKQVQDGGTSLACPLFSASLVLVNQARSLLNKSTPIGQAAPYLYAKKDILLSSRSLNLIVPPAVIISGATPPPSITIQGTPAPASAFTLGNVTFGWDSALTVEPENQFWNDAVGVGSPNLPYFVMTMGNM